jgi:hypothetical protein
MIGKKLLQVIIRHDTINERPDNYFIVLWKWEGELSQRG